MLDTIEKIRTFSDELKDALDSLSEGVAGNSKELVAQLLSQYSVIIPKVDERLTKCGALLERGLRDEALSYASEAPSLLEVVGFLDLASQPHWEKWKATLALHEMPAPVGPKTEIARELNAAEIHLAELKPLLSKLRRAVLANGPLGQRLWVLRKLREADSTCLAWIESIQEHEKQRLMEMEAEVPIAFRQKNEAALQGISKELQSDWIETPPTRLVSAVKKSLKTIKEDRVVNQLAIIADALALAKEEGDLDSARELKGQWSALEKEKGSFSVADLSVTKAIPVLDWIQQHDDIERLYLDLEIALDQQPASRKQRLEWINSIKQSTFKIDGLATDLEAEVDRSDINRLLDRANEEVTRHDADETQRRRWMYFTIGAVCVTAITATWLFISARHYTETVELALQDLRTVLQRVESGEETTRPVLAETVPLAVLSDERVLSSFRELERVFNNEEERRQQLAIASRELDAALASIEGPGEGITAWPEGFGTAIGLLEGSLSALPKTGQEKADTIRKKGAVEGKMRRFQDKADLFCKQKINELNVKIDNALVDVRKNPVAAAGAAATLRNELDKLEKEAMKIALPSVAGEYTQWRMVSKEGQKLFDLRANSVKQNLEHLEKRVKDIKGITLVDSRLDAALGNWKNYAELLNTAANEFKVDAKEYAEAAKLEGFWLAIDQWNQLAQDCSAIGTLDESRAKELKKKIDALMEDADSRFKELQCVKEFTKQDGDLLEAFATRKSDELLVVLKDWSAREWLAEIEFTVSTGDEVLYCRKKPTKGEKYTEVITGLKTAAQGWPQERKFIGDEWTVARSPQAVLADDLQEHEWTKLPNRIPGLSGDKFLIDCIQRVLSAEEVDPCLRLVNARKFFLIGRGDDTFRSVCFDIQAAREFYPLIDGPGGIPEITLEELGLAFTPERNGNGTYRAVRSRAENILEQAAKTLQAIEKELSQIAIRCRVGRKKFLLAGRIIVDERGRKALRAKTPGIESGALVAVDSSGAFVPAGEVVGGVVLLAQEVPVPAGTPCFLEVPIASSAQTK